MCGGNCGDILYSRQDSLRNKILNEVEPKRDGSRYTHTHTHTHTHNDQPYIHAARNRHDAHTHTHTHTQHTHTVTLVHTALAFPNVLLRSGAVISGAPFFS